ncbi:MAG: site-specific integrase [Bacteroidales bacterium]|nr:site-specific integrase [Bacteroidales bacterium]
MKKTKNRLPSGSYRVQVFDYKDDDGKKHYKSFTAPTRAEAEFNALQWKNAHPNHEKPSMSLSEVVARYIELKRGVLSPATVRGYESIQRNRLSPIGDISIDDLTQSDVQEWVSRLAREYSPKYIRNCYGLVSATLEMFCPENRMKVTLPAKQRPELYCPSDADIRTLLDEIHGTELEIAVLLAAFGPLRRGEICALTSDDIHGNTISVSKSMVRGDDGWHVKQPKTYGSYREVEFPDFVIQRLQGIEGRLIHINPEQISDQFHRALAKTDLPHFRFHDLRHYCASILHAIGVPDQYIMQRGGWISDNVMKTVYRNAIDTETQKQTQKINDYFSNNFRVTSV